MTTRTMLVCVATLVVFAALGCGSASQNVTGPSSSKCAVAATADPAAFPPSGGSGNIAVSTNRECQWRASASGGWIQLNGNSSGQGEARIPFVVTANSDPAVRRGAISVGDQQIGITQEAAACQLVVAPASTNVPAAGGRGSIQVTASSAQCVWTARSETAWLKILEGAQGTGTGQVVFDADGTAGPPRTGTLTIAGRTVTVAQGDGCITSITPTTQAVGAGGGSGAVSVTVGEGCPWSASSAVPWIAIASGATGSGPGEVRFTVAANTSPERSGTLAVAGRTFTVTQASGCSVSLSPTSQVAPSGGGPGTIGIAVGASCPWTASASATWVQITGDASGAGPGSVTFAVEANVGPARQASITAGGRVFTIQQNAGCTYSLSAPGILFQANGGGGTVHVQTTEGCSWTASTPESEPWFQISAGHTGTGTGPVHFWALPNDGPERSGILTAAGQPFSVRQLSGCSVSIDPTGQAFGPEGGTGTFAVTAGEGCLWSASSDVEWIAIVEGGTGSGAETVRFSVQPNSGEARAGRITVGGQVFTVTQTGP